MEKTKWDLSDTLNQEHLSYMQKIHNSTYQKELAKAKERQLKKFTKLHVKKLAHKQKHVTQQRNRNGSLTFPAMTSKKMKKNSWKKD